MPKVISYTPSWLSRPSPGFQMFNNSIDSPRNPAQTRQRSPSQKEYGNGSGGGYAGPTTTVVQRGTEIFAVAGKEIRWSDLVMLKDNFEDSQTTPSKQPKPNVNQSSAPSGDNGPEDSSYRVLKVPVGEEIRQLSISPNGRLLAIVTSHTVQLAILPDSSHLGQIPNQAIRLKTYTIGPTTHVLSQSQISKVLWHPCGVAGNCLVTVTVDAVVRLWEFNQDNRWSSDSPSLAVDLKKLVTGSSYEENFTPEKFGRNRGFSSDTVGLEVASACFGGTGSSNEAAWSGLTLWLAMKGGDVYALCPLIPAKWQPSATLIPLISTATVAKMSANQDQSSVDIDEKQRQGQLQWIQNIDSQEPQMLLGDTEFSPDIEVFNRPAYPSAIPRLQGPFQTIPEDADDDMELSDIYVVASKCDANELMGDDDSDSDSIEIDGHGLTATMVCLLTRSGRVYVSLDLEGIEGQWLPQKKPSNLPPPPKDPYLIVLEGLDTLTPNDALTPEWPSFSRDVKSRYSFFVTHNRGVFFFSLDSWVQSLEQELHSNECHGAPFRLDIIRNSAGTLRERILSFNHEDSDDVVDKTANASLIFQDSDLGYFLLTSVGGQPQAATFDWPSPDMVSTPDEEEDESYMPQMDALALGPARSAYQAPASLWEVSAMPSFFDRYVPNHQRRVMKEDNIRLSTATLDIMTAAHRVISHETHKFGTAAADLFRRCERLQDELRDQISRANEVAYRTERIVGQDADSYLDDIEEKATTVDSRLDRIKKRHEELTSRYEALRRNFSRVDRKELSEKERLWSSEVEKMDESVGNPAADQAADQDEGELVERSEQWQRYEKAKSLAEDLVARANAPTESQAKDDSEISNTMIPAAIRQAKVIQVMKMLERESALVDATQSRLEHLNMVSIA